MQIYADTIVYIMCPAHIHSGGPELMHQLGSRLIAQKIDTRIYYYDKKDDDPVNDLYKHYQVPVADSLSDVPANILIMAETALSAYYAVRHMRRIIWWLSVDHYFMNIQDYFGNLLAHPLDIRVPRYYMFGDDSCALHLVQSEYARQFLAVNEIPDDRIDHLGDYLNAAFLQNAETYLQLEKKDLVLYNPKKGADFTARLISAAPDLHWIPIQNLTPHQVSLLLAGGKVYIDFGYHPGKDRIPREAAMCGCCVITGRRGAAANETDVPIPDTYKFEDTEENIPAILSLIREILSDYEAHCGNFDSYRTIIRGEQKEFIRDAERIFQHV